MAAFTPVRSVTAAGSATAITTTGIVTKAGDLLVAIVTCFNNRIGTVTDSKSNTWATAVASTGTTTGFVAMFSAVNCLGGSAHTFTFTPTSSDFIAIAVLEVEGAALAGVLGSTNGAVANSTTHATSNITSGAGAAECFVGAGAISAGAEGLPTFNTAWYQFASIGGSSSEGMAAAFRLVNPSTTDLFTYTLSTAQNEGVIIAGFKSATAAATGGASSFTFCS